VKPLHRHRHDMGTLHTQWSHNGHTMVTQRSHNGHKMVTQWSLAAWPARKNGDCCQHKGCQGWDAC
jgi:hypothetical protein